MESLFSKVTLESLVNPKDKITNERQSVIKQFLAALNAHSGEKYLKNGKWCVVRKVSPSYVAFRLSHLDLQDLYVFLSMCKDSRGGFSKCFYGALKPKT